MEMFLKKRFKRIILWFAFVFMALFLFRLVFGYTKKNVINSSTANFFESISDYKRKNYASKKYELSLKPASQIKTKLDQKYEKIAEINTKSTEFEIEEKNARTQIKKYNALIQFEQKSGNKGYRKLNLVIGVPPRHFDSLYKRLIKIGEVQAKRIIKKDKTNEYKELNAQRESLEKNLKSLIDLKTKGGKIEEFMNLENRILEIESRLQDLGVSLGDFDDENEFCTVQFSLNEVRKIKIGIMQRIKVALEWTVKIYLRIVLALFFMTLSIYAILFVIDKLKIIQSIINKKQ